MENENLKKLHGCKAYNIRGLQVVLDFDAAELYEVELKALHRAVTKNPKRFPDDFMFQLTNSEWVDLKEKRDPGTWPVAAVHRSFLRRAVYVCCRAY